MKKSFLSNVLLAFLSLLLFLSALEAGGWLYFRAKGTLNEYEDVFESQGITPLNKKPGEKRIFVLGESAVEGIPYSKDISFTGFLEKLMKEAGPEAKIINAGIKGRHSFYLYEAGPSLIRYKADAVILYAGNNDTRDFSNVIRDVPFAWLDFKLTWNSFFYWGFKRKLLDFKQKVNQAAKREVFVINHNQDDVWHWTDLYIRKKKQYMEDPELGLKRKHRAIRDFEENMGGLVRSLKKKNIQVYVCELAINHEAAPGIHDNLKNKGPRGKGYDFYVKNKFASDQAAGAWQASFDAGAAALQNKKFRAALRHFRKAAAISDTYPLLAHSIAECRKGLKRFDEARKMFIRAKDLQIQSPGGDSLKRAALQAVAEKYQVPWIPLQPLLESVVPNGLLGENLFLDHCHFNLLGNKLVASILMEALCRSKGTGGVSCPAEPSWQDWFKKISAGGLDQENLAREYLTTGFYLINGTLWDKAPNFTQAVFYLEKAKDLSPKNWDAYSLLALSYWNLGEKDKSRAALLKLKELGGEAYERALAQYPALQETLPGTT